MRCLTLWKWQYCTNLNVLHYHKQHSLTFKITHTKSSHFQGTMPRFYNTIEVLFKIDMHTGQFSLSTESMKTSTHGLCEIYTML
jgi:polyisoprenoid-binding protein YceI